jgi:hypothetical protein
MTLTIPLKDIVITLHQLHPLPSGLIPPPIFYYQLEHTFVLDRTLFAQALATTPYLSLNKRFGMVYEHFSRCFILEDPSWRFLKLFQVVIITHGDIPKSVALMLGTIRLLAMAKDINGLRLIIVSKLFFRLINHSIVLQLQGPFQEHLSLY